MSNIIHTPNIAYLDDGYMKYPGWGQTVENRPEYTMLWDSNRLGMLQQKITQLLEGVSEDGRPIVVPLTTIGHVISEVYAANSPRIGDIYSRFIHTEPESNRNDVRDIEDRAINIIFSQIKNEMLNEQNNKRLTIWSTVYGDFNAQGLRAHAPIKIRKRRPAPMMFNMNY
jgi:hypothetical protein